MVLGTIHIFTEANCHYAIINKKLSIYNGIITNTIINIKYLVRKEEKYMYFFHPYIVIWHLNYKI